MPNYQVIGPDGRSYKVTAPTGATMTQVLAYAKAHPAVAPVAAVPAMTDGQDMAETAVGGMARPPAQPASPADIAALDTFLSPPPTGTLRGTARSAARGALSPDTAMAHVGRPNGGAELADFLKLRHGALPADPRSLFEKARSSLEAANPDLMAEQPVGPVEGAVQGATQMGVDLPIYMAGGALGAPAGVLASGAASFALPSLLRGDNLRETAKQAIIGAGFGVGSKLGSAAVEMVLKQIPMPAIAASLARYAGSSAAGGAMMTGTEAIQGEPVDLQTMLRDQIMAAILGTPHLGHALSQMARVDPAKPPKTAPAQPTDLPADPINLEAQTAGLPVMGTPLAEPPSPTKAVSPPAPAEVPPPEAPPSLPVEPIARGADRRTGNIGPPGDTMMDRRSYEDRRQIENQSAFPLNQAEVSANEIVQRTVARLMNEGLTPEEIAGRQEFDMLTGLDAAGAQQAVARIAEGIPAQPEAVAARRLRLSRQKGAEDLDKAKLAAAAETPTERLERVGTETKAMTRSSSDIQPLAEMFVQVGNRKIQVDSFEDASNKYQSTWMDWMPKNYEQRGRLSKAPPVSIVDASGHEIGRIKGVGGRVFGPGNSTEVLYESIEARARRAKVAEDSRRFNEAKAAKTVASETPEAKAERIASEQVAMTPAKPNIGERGSAPLGLAAPEPVSAPPKPPKPKGERGSLTLTGGAPIEFKETPPDAGLGRYIRRPSNLITRFGERASQAIETVLLHGNRMVTKTEVGKDRLDAALSKVPLGFKKVELGLGLPKFTFARLDDLLRGRSSAEVTAKLDRMERLWNVGHKGDSKQAAKFKAFREAAAEIDAWRNERLGAIREELKERGMEEDIAANWGVVGYLPEMHPGSFRVMMVLKDGSEHFIGAASTKLEAKTKIHDHYVNRGDIPLQTYRVESRDMIPPDMTRTSTRNKYRLVSEIAKAAEIDKDDIAEAMRGKIGTRAGKTKYWNSLQQRHGYEGYETDLRWVLHRYEAGFHRWLELSRLNREVVPIIEDMRHPVSEMESRLKALREGDLTPQVEAQITQIERGLAENAYGMPRLADEIQSNLDQLWGVRGDPAKALDATLEKIPGIRQFHKPFALERWSQRLRTVAAFAQLTTPRFAVMQTFQLMQTLWPTVTTPELLRGMKSYKSAEGQALLTKYGVKRSAGKYHELTDSMLNASPWLRKWHMKLRDVAGFEARNQSIAFLTLYGKGRSLGMSEQAAVDYGVLKGQFYTQFLPSPADYPKAMRGPILKTVFQYKRYMVGNLEIASDLIRDRNYPGVAKWVAANLVLGGLRGVTKYIGLPLMLYGLGKRLAGKDEEADQPTPALDTLKLNKQINDAFGPTLGPLVMYGLPGLVGVDMSNSTMVLDQLRGENLAEKIGNVALGASGSLAVSAITAYNATSGPSDAGFASRLGTVASQRLPLVKVVDGVRRMWQRDFTYEGPDGKKRYEADWREIMKQMGAFRSTDLDAQSMFIDTMYEIRTRRSVAINKIVQARLAKDQATSHRELSRWQELWGAEFPITEKDIKTRMKSKTKLAEEDQVRRSEKQSGKVITKGLAPYRPESMKESD